MLEPTLFESFFHCLDPVRRLQYPEDDQDTPGFVDMNPGRLRAFLLSVDYPELDKASRYVGEFHLGLAPAGDRDPPVCTDRVLIEFDTRRCRFRMVMLNNFLVEPNWFTENSVVYGSTIGEDRISDFYRDEAG